jgi:hypothetical protein
MRKGYQIKKRHFVGYLSWIVLTPSGKAYEIDRFDKKYSVTFLSKYPDIYCNPTIEPFICKVDSKEEALKAIYAEEEKAE